MLSLLVITWGSLRTVVGSKAMAKRAEVKNMPQLTEAGDGTFELLTLYEAVRGIERDGEGMVRRGDGFNS